MRFASMVAARRRWTNTATVLSGSARTMTLNPQSNTNTKSYDVVLHCRVAIIRIDNIILWYYYNAIVYVCYGLNFGVVMIV